MDFAPTPAEERLREEVRAFLRERLAPADARDDGWIVGFSREFSRALGERGWIGYTWPKRYGGSEGSYLERLIITEELLRAGAPVAAHWMADRQIGPALLAHGSEEQRRELLPRIVRGELVFCVGMSEPNAGSDLAALRTRAVADGDHYVVDGHKIWTTNAHEADYCYLVARTDPHAAKHRGLSELLVDMRTPGITVRPIIDMAGEHHFNEIFFEGVRVERRWLVGEENRGWYQIAAQLDYERSGIERLLSNARVLEDVRAHARETGLAEDPLWRDRLASVLTRVTIGRWLIYRVAWLLSQGIVPNKESALTKAFATELEQEIAELAAQALGPHALLLPGSPAARLAGRVARAVAFAPGYTIMGGTSTILRNILALRGLGLPAA
ncbi:MAG: acyl-CoA dehydrogenase family protein [Deltaproteobacteria bacterium]|nr:acyl-CoA dehydrogenase family protein [Deltaproteobacteria bacterium]